MLIATSNMFIRIYRSFVSKGSSEARRWRGGKTVTRSDDCAEQQWRRPAALGSNRGVKDCRESRVCTLQEMESVCRCGRNSGVAPPGPAHTVDVLSCTCIVRIAKAGAFDRPYSSIFLRTNTTELLFWCYLAGGGN